MSDDKSVAFFTGAFLAGVGVVIFLVLWLFGFNFGIRHSGTVDSTDCKTTEYLQDGDWGTYFHPFYCLFGSCEAVELDSNGHCKAHYIFSPSKQ